MTTAPPADPVQPEGDGVVGRRRELVALRRWLDTARHGAGRLVLCTGEPGIGKTRLAQELAGQARAAWTTVAWARCVETEGAPALWPWQQVLRTLAIDPVSVLAGEFGSAEDRFLVVDRVAQAVLGAAGDRGLVVVLDDIHSADEPSLLVLGHLAHQMVGSQLLVFTTMRQVAPASALPRLLPDLLRSPAVERLDLTPFGLAEVGEQLIALVPAEMCDPGTVLDITGGNPLFVREVARAMADGTWRAQRPPRTVLDVVGARLARVSGDCRALVQAAAIVGRDFSLHLVAAAIDVPLECCLASVNEAITHGLVDQVGDQEEYRFVHALTRDAVEASLPISGRVALHRLVVQAMEARLGPEVTDHLADIARHWAELAPHGEADAARRWMTRAAHDAVRRLAYEDGARLFCRALALDPASLPDDERCRLLVGLGRARFLAGDLEGCLDAATSAADAARTAETPELLAEAALVIEATPDSSINVVAKGLCGRPSSASAARGTRRYGRDSWPSAATWRSTTASRSASIR